MRFNRWIYALAALILVMTTVVARAQSAALPPARETVQTNPDDPERKEAFAVFDRHKMVDAVPLLEKVVSRYPNDLVAHDHLGVALASRSATWNEMEKRRDDRLAARRELLRAKELGDDSPLCNIMLKGLPEDGSESPYSAQADVDAAMKRGEAAFANGDLETALREYMLACDLDPKLYRGALYVGDTWFRLKKTDKAGEWFARAIQIEPNQEIAYRYWGDALMADARMKEARTKFMEAVVAWPYQQIVWDGLNQWVKRNQLEYKDVKVDLPKPPDPDAKGGITITVDPGSLEKSGGAAWMTYSMERALWTGEKFGKEFPQEKTYRHSLKEEVSALSVTASVYEELRASKRRKKAKDSLPDPQLDFLVRLKAAGMLEPFVLLMHPDQAISKDYADYQAAHRDKLMEFLDKYLVPEAP